MKIAFLASDKPRERILADAFLQGAARHGHETEVFALGQDPEPGRHDVVCMVGVKSRERFAAFHAAGAHVVYLDKGYSRHKSLSALRGWEYWRVSIDAHHPTKFLSAQRSPSDRMEAIGWTLESWKKGGETIVFAGSSQKYSDFYDLPDPQRYAREIMKTTRLYSERPFIYRPKPSYSDAKPITKARFSPPEESLAAVLRNAHVLVTHGSNACFEAVLAGVPCIVLGEGVAQPISTTELCDIETPRYASRGERQAWAQNLAYWQWTLAEMSRGEAWAFLGEMIHHG